MFAKTKLYKNLLPYWLSILGFVLLGLILFFIWDRIIQINFSNFKLTEISYFPLFIALILMPFNWFLESHKWGKLIDHIQKISIVKKYKSVFYGQAFGILTPNRLGDYGGRLFYIKKENRIKALQANFVSSIYQTTITFSIGIPAILYWISLNTILDQKIDSIVWLAIVILFLCVLLLTFQLKKILYFLLRFKMFNNYADEIQWFFQLPKRTLSKILFFSFFRYLVFLMQYILVVYSFESDFSIVYLITVIASIYLLTTLIPTAFISDLIVRGAIGILLFLPIIQSEETILLISLIVWFINIALAAIVGSLLFLNHKKIKS